MNRKSWITSLRPLDTLLPIEREVERFSAEKQLPPTPRYSSKRTKDARSSTRILRFSATPTRMPILRVWPATAGLGLPHARDPLATPRKMIWKRILHRSGGGAENPPTLVPIVTKTGNGQLLSSIQPNMDIRIKMPWKEDQLSRAQAETHIHRRPRPRHLTLVSQMVIRRVCRARPLRIVMLTDNAPPQMLP